MVVDAKSIKLKNPTPALVEKYLAKFNGNKRYYLADAAIIDLFKKYPKNDRLEDILLKISVINDLYSTNIFGTFYMAEHILKLNIDKDLEEGSLKVVNKIAKITMRGKKINFYSFATKYCNWHNKEVYPIFDSFVEKVLKYYRNTDSFADFSNNELREYVKFKTVLAKFREFYGLENYNFKEIDKFLWMYGKEMFSAK